MKKLICFAAAIIMMLGMVCPALAVEASYKNGYVTVSTGDEGFYEIIVDGIYVGKWVGTGHPTNTFAMELEPGEHRVRLYSPDGDGGSSTVFTVEGKKDEGGSAPAPTVKPDPEKRDENHTHTPKIVPAVEAGHGVDGKTQGVVCAVCGQVIQPQEIIPGESHQYIVTEKKDNKITYECKICGEKVQLGAKEPLKNRYGSIILNEKGKPTPYEAATDGSDEKTVVLSLEEAAGKAELVLENALIMQIIREGYKAVKVVNGKITMTVDLYQVTPSWFSTDARIDSYHFTVDSEANLTVQAEANGEKLTAESYSGVTAK